MLEARETGRDVKHPANKPKQQHNIVLGKPEVLNIHDEPDDLLKDVEFVDDNVLVVLRFERGILVVDVVFWKVNYAIEQKVSLCELGIHCFLCDGELRQCLLPNLQLRFLDFGGRRLAGYVDVLKLAWDGCCSIELYDT